MTTIERVIDIKEKLNLSYTLSAKLIGVAPGTLSRWALGKVKPNQVSLEKLQKFIDDYENGSLDLPKPKQLPKNDIENIENVEKRPMYELIYKLENKYGGNLRNVPDNEPDLKILRMIGDGVL